MAKEDPEKGSKDKDKEEKKANASDISDKTRHYSKNKSGKIGNQ